VSAFAQDEVLSGAEMEAADAAEILEEEEAQEIFDIYGEIVEITDEYVLIDTPDMGHVQVNLSEDTVIEGVEALEIGQTAVVMYDGMMTRSLPPQITALHIGVYAVSGVISEVLEDRIVILQEETGEEIILMLPGSELLGENEELLESEELAAQEESEEVSEEDAEEGSEEEIETESEDEALEAEVLEAEVLEEEILSEDELTEEAVLEDELLEDEAPVFGVGDAIIAYTDGTMTMSLPPQMRALAIVFAGEAIAEESEEEEEIEASEEIEETEETEESDETVG